MELHLQYLITLYDWHDRTQSAFVSFRRRRRRPRSQENSLRKFVRHVSSLWIFWILIALLQLIHTHRASFDSTWTCMLLKPTEHTLVWGEGARRRGGTCNPPTCVVCVDGSKNYLQKWAVVLLTLLLASTRAPWCKTFFAVTDSKVYEVW